MPIFVILPCESLGVVIAINDRTFFWSFVLVGEHMSLQVLENLSAVWVGASPLLSCLLAAEVVLAAVRVN